MKMAYFNTCEICGANLDPGERCICERKLDVIKEAQDLLCECMDAKKYGIEVFFSFRAHVDVLEIEVFRDGWERYRDSNATCEIRLDKPEAGREIRNIAVKISKLSSDKELERRLMAEAHGND